MDDAQVGSVIRAVRIRRGLTQAEVAAKAGVSRALISAVESGALESTSLRLLRRIGNAVGVSLPVDPRWRGAELAKLLDEKHALLIRELVARLSSMGWQVLAERTFAIWGERGSIDVLAWHPERRALAAMEVKTKLVDLQGLLSTMDRKRRLAPVIAGELGWRPTTVSSVLVLPEETGARNAVGKFEPIFAAVMPARTREVVRWLRQPRGNLAGIWFLVNATAGGTKQRFGGGNRVRRRGPGELEPLSRSAAGHSEGGEVASGSRSSAEGAKCHPG